MAAETRLFATLNQLKDLLSKVEDPVRDDWDPIELGLLVAQLEYEDLSIESERARFGELCAYARKNFPAKGSFSEQCQYVSKVFGEELGFSGDKVNYYNIRNSYLNDVRLRRKGIPITLSLVYMALCRAVGLKAVGVAFPGHFLVRVLPNASRVEIGISSGREKIEDWKNQLYVDVFEGGTFLTVQDCERRLQEWTRGALNFGPDVLRLAHPAEMLTRILRNLKAILSEKEDYARLYWVLTALIELSETERVDALKDRGLLMARMGRFQAATQDLEAFAQSCGDSSKLSHIEKLLKLFASQKEVIN